MPAKWRTKSGCLTCRIRRKKCDEEGSACRACRRNGLTCIWQSITTPADGGHNTPPNPNIDRNNGPSSLHLSPFENPSREALFRHFASTVLPHLLMPGTPSASGNELLALGAQYPCVRDSLLACGAVFLSTGSQPVPRHAVVYYSDAVHSTRKMIEESRLDGTEDWLFVQTLLLCIFERAQSGPSCGAMSHLLGASRIMALKVGNATYPQSTRTSPLQQICAATLLYHAATTALLSPDVTWLPEDASWEQVQHYIEPSYTPLFAMPPSLCRLILQISRFARRTPLNYRDKLFATRLREQLNPYLPLQSASEAVCGDHGPVHGTDEIRRAAELYALAADILLLKVTQPHITAGDSRVQGRVKQILNILQSDVHGLFWNQHYVWPFAIVGCAVQRETEMLFLLGRLEKLWERSHWGDIKRISNLFRTMLHFRRQNDARSANSPDPFDLLLDADGLSKFMG